MQEPLLSIEDNSNLMDILLQMDMEDTLNHPVIVEVLSVVQEGQYSVDTSIFNLSQTFQTFIQMPISEEKSITSRLIQNIKAIEQDDMKQSSLHFNIWKYCLEQRLLDETWFTILVNAFKFVLILLLIYRRMVLQNEVKGILRGHFLLQTRYIIEATPNQLEKFCPPSSSTIQSMYVIFGYIYSTNIFTLFGSLTSAL